MSAALDRRAYAELTTSTVPTGEAFAYWGGARDRLPLALTDPLVPGDPPRLPVTARGRWSAGRTTSA